MCVFGYGNYVTGVPYTDEGGCLAATAVEQILKHPIWDFCVLFLIQMLIYICVLYVQIPHKICPTTGFDNGINPIRGFYIESIDMLMTLVSI
jgi:hypothetical protein